MTVTRRHIKSLTIEGVACLGAVSLGDRIVLHLAGGQKAETVRAAFGPSLLKLDGHRHCLRATLAVSERIIADPPELQLLAGKNVLVAFRNGETSEALAEWLRFHSEYHDAEAALVYDRSEPSEGGFADTLETALPVIVLTGDLPLGRQSGPDMRHADTAPARPGGGVTPTNSWHGPFIEHGIVDLIRHRFLSKARAVVFAQISDLVRPLPDEISVFDLATRNPGAFIALRGIETYPWRLRQGRPAPYSDHIASRRSEQRTLISWAIAPNAEDTSSFWRLGQPIGVDAADAAPVPIIRAMGACYPGVPVKDLVRKGDLEEQSALVDLMKNAFDAEPVRVPVTSGIPSRSASARFTIVTAMKNEGPFVLDWVAHNRSIGVDQILVYTNDCYDGTVELLDALADAGVTRRDNPYREKGRVPQHAAFRAAEDEPLVQDADWLMTLDVDEYLNIHAGDGSVNDLLAAMPEAHVISIPWRLFGNSDRHRFEDVPVCDQFVLCAPEYAPVPVQAWAFKTMYRNEGLFRRLGVHRPKGLAKDVRGNLVWTNANGTHLPPMFWENAWRMTKTHWGYTHAAINHYAVRSAESFLVKRDRGKVNRTEREQGAAYWFRMNHNAQEDKSIQRLAPNVTKEKAALLSLPGVAEAHARTVAWHKERIAELLSDPDYATVYDQITSNRMQHLSRMTTYFGINVHMQGPQVIPDEIAARDPSVPFFWTTRLPES